MCTVTHFQTAFQEHPVHLEVSQHQGYCFGGPHNMSIIVYRGPYRGFREGKPNKYRGTILQTLTANVIVSEYGLFPKLWAAFGYRLYYGTKYSVVPIWDPNFGNYPYAFPAYTSPGPNQLLEPGALNNVVQGSKPSEHVN